MILMDENYSIQAKNLLDNLVGEYKSSITSIHRIDIVVKQIKTIRIEVNKRSRWISEVSNISKDIANKKVKILIYNEEYIKPIEKELESLELRFLKNGQFLDVIQPDFSYNQLMSLVDDIESKKNKIISKCTKAKMDPVIRSKHAVENEFIDHAIARKTSNNCQKMFEKYESVIFEMTLNKIKSILGHENFERFEKEGFLD